MNTYRILLTSFIVFIAAACGTTVYTVNPNNNDLNDYDTFAYLPNTNMDVKGKNYTDTTINKSIVETVKNNLEDHGMEIDQEEPDLLVLISTSAKVDIEVDKSPTYATYPYHDASGRVSPMYDTYFYYEYETVSDVEGYNATTFTHDEGTVVIDLIDRKTNKTVWKGIANDKIYDDPSPEVVENMIQDLFDEFPVDEES